MKSPKQKQLDEIETARLYFMGFILFGYLVVKAITTL